MAFCNKCGNQLPDGANNCPKCGAPVGGTQQNAQGFVNNMMNTADSTAQFDPQDITAHRNTLPYPSACLPQLKICTFPYKSGSCAFPAWFSRFFGNRYYHYNSFCRLGFRSYLRYCRIYI